MRSIVGLALVALLLVACAPGSAGHGSQQADGVRAAKGDALVLQRAGGLVEVDAGTGTVLAEAPGGVISGDGTAVLATTHDAHGTVLERIDTASGRVTDRIQLDEALAIRAVSRDGTHVALMPPVAAGSESWAPAGRRSTDITVVDVSQQDVRLLHLPGNLEPESFSTGNESLFVLSYLPATAPTKYRVARIYVEKPRRVWDVLGPDKAPVENMTATRLHQVPAPNGSALYTLYSNQPPAALAANGATTIEPDERAFVHDLELGDDVGFAFCIELPDVFGSAPSSGSAIAVTPDGTHVFAVDAPADTVAAVTLKGQRVREVSADLSGLGGDRTAAVTSADGAHLIVAGGTSIAVVDPSTGEVSARWAVDAPVTGLALSPDGARLYVATADRVSVLDAATGRHLGTVGGGGDAIVAAVAG